MNPHKFSGYLTESFYDEMFGLDGSGEVLTHYQPIFDRIGGMNELEIEEKKKQADSSFLEHGVTFTVYGDDKGTERIFPFDLIPRVIPDQEWQTVEQGLRQRLSLIHI